MPHRWQCLVLMTILLCLSVYSYLQVFPHPIELIPPPSAPKYFHESKTNSHLDGRFAHSDRFHIPLTPVIQTYLHTMAALGLETWLAHGTLLGWYWGQRALPWDSDADVHISFESLRSMVDRGYNMTVYDRFSPAGVTEGEETRAGQYLLDINPHWNDGRVPNVRFGWKNENRIDARFIDMSNGAFIDITAVTTIHSRGRRSLLVSKDGHTYPYNSVFPLQRSTFEGILASVPSESVQLLRKEYGVEALETEVFHG